MRMWKIVLGNKGNTRSNVIIKGTIVILIFSLVVTIVMTRRVMMTNEKIYSTTLQHNLVHINDSKIYLEQIINDYNNKRTPYCVPLSINIWPLPTITILYSGLRGIKLYLADLGWRRIDCNISWFSS